MSPVSLPDLPSLDTITARLAMIFPEGMEHRGYLTREIAAKTVFVMLYVGAVEGAQRWVRPDQVTKMTDAQSARSSVKARLAWAEESLGRGGQRDIAGRWYAVNTRESIRDETLRAGLVRTGAVIERTGLPTTSAKPRYALACAFAALLDERITGRKLTARIEKWQQEHLGAAALARIRLVKAGLAGGAGDEVAVRLPHGEVRHMSPGTSSVISKAVIEQFASRFLRQPGVLLLSEPGHKVVAQDDALARSINLIIDPATHLPDIVLVDLGAPGGALPVFVEVVATDGPITADRKAALLALATEAGFTTQQVAFVTAFLDRGQAAVRKALDSLAWGSFVWFAAEPEMIISLHDADQTPRPLWEIMPAGHTPAPRRTKGKRR